MEFYEIKYFCSICEFHSFSRAAAAIHISQPALSQCIQKMENELGASVFKRGTRPLVLTEVGELVYSYGLQILQLRENLDGAIREVVHSDDVEIKAGMSPFYSKHYLPAIMKKVKSQFPNIKLSITEDISGNLETLLKNRELDFCTIPQEPEIDGLLYEPICMEEILLAIPPGSPLKDKAIPGNPWPWIDPGLLSGHRLVQLKQVQKISQLLKPLFEAQNLHFQVSYETLDWDTVNIMIANDMGIGFVPDILANSMPGPVSPLYFRITSTGFQRHYSIAYKAEKTFTPLERHLISIFHSSIQEVRDSEIK